MDGGVWCTYIFSKRTTKSSFMATFSIELPSFFSDDFLMFSGNYQKLHLTVLCKERHHSAHAVALDAKKKVRRFSIANRIAMDRCL